MHVYVYAYDIVPCTESAVTDELERAWYVYMLCVFVYVCVCLKYLHM